MVFKKLVLVSTTVALIAQNAYAANVGSKAMSQAGKAAVNAAETMAKRGRPKKIKIAPQPIEAPVQPAQPIQSIQPVQPIQPISLEQHLRNSYGNCLKAVQKAASQGRQAAQGYIVEAQGCLGKAQNSFANYLTLSKANLQAAKNEAQIHLGSLADKTKTQWTGFIGKAEQARNGICCAVAHHPELSLGLAAATVYAAATAAIAQIMKGESSERVELARDAAAIADKARKAASQAAMAEAAASKAELSAEAEVAPVAPAAPTAPAVETSNKIESRPITWSVQNIKDNVNDGISYLKSKFSK